MKLKLSLDGAAAGAVKDVAARGAKIDTCGFDVIAENTGKEWSASEEWRKVS